MRVFGLLSLVIVLGITAVLLKRQLTSLHVAPAVSTTPVEGQSTVGDVRVPDVSRPAQARRLEQQVQGDLDRASQEHAQQIERALDEGASKP